MRVALEVEPTRLRAAIRALVRRFAVAERAEAACCGLTVAQAAALEALGGEGPLRLGDLGRRLGIAPSTMTRNLARLEASGLVERQTDAQDARSARVGLTGAGKRAARAAEAQEEAFAGQVLGRIPAARRAVVVESLHELLTAVRDATEDCCPGAFDHLVEGPEGAGAGAGTGAEAGRCGEACGCGPEPARRGAKR